MKTVIIIMLLFSHLILICLFLWSGKAMEDAILKYQKKIVRMSAENARLSMELVKARLGGEWPHVKKQAD